MAGHPARIRLKMAVTLLFSLALPSLEHAQTASFVARRDFIAGFGVGPSIAAGDFNGDGVPDLVTVTSDPGSSNSGVSVLLGNRDGTFQAPTKYVVGYGALSVAIGDFNGDGKLDLAVSNFGSDDVSYNVAVLLGNGDGTFRAGGNYATGQVPFFVAVGDFNGDGKPDLAVVNRGNGLIGVPATVQVLGGNGDGTFQPARDVVAGRGTLSVLSLSVAVGDFNGDGRMDLAVTDFGNPTVLQVFLGNTDGFFSARTSAVSASSDARPSILAVGDFSGDGHLDLAVLDASVGNVFVMIGNGDGTFYRTPASTPVDLYLNSAAAGDFNGDGKLDLAFTFGEGDLSILLGNGDGTFQAAGNHFSVGFAASSVAAADFNGDGKLDIVTSSFEMVSVLLGNGDGTFVTAPSYATHLSPSSVATGDFNGDGKLDLAVANFGSQDVLILLGKGDGTFLPGSAFPASRPGLVVVGDFNGDGKLDLAVISPSNCGDSFIPGSISVLLGNGDGTFQSAQTVAEIANPASLVVGDFNGDGKMDLAVATASGPRPCSSQPGNVSVLLGKGDGTFQAAQAVAGVVNPLFLAAGDVNADGKLDLAVTIPRSCTGSGCTPGSLSVVLGNGDGTFQAAADYAAGDFPSSVVVADFNGDGVQDLAVASSASGSTLVSVLLGNGDGTFQAAKNSGEGPPNPAGSFNSYQFLGVGDFNGDGKLDLAAIIIDDISVLQGNGDGTFGPAAIFFGAGSLPRSFAAGDFNGDGRLDLAVTGSSNEVSILINNTSQASYALTVSETGNGSGTVTSSPAGMNCEPHCTASYASGTPVTLTAQAAMGSNFAGWSGCDRASGATCTVTMNAAKSLTASFNLQRFALTVSKEGVGRSGERSTVTSSSTSPDAATLNCGATCSAVYDWGTVVTLTANPANGFHVAGWSGCDTVSGATCMVTISGAKSVTASFEPHGNH